MTDFFADLEAQLRDAHARRPSRLARARAPLTAALALAAVAGAAVAIALALAGGAGERRSASPAPSGRALAVPTTPAPPPAARDRVAILNGTRTVGLGRDLANRLQGQGFTISFVSDAPRQDVARTSISFSGGALNTALAAAARLRVRGVARVPHLASEAGPADVVITVGEDARNGIVGAPPVAASFPLLAPGQPRGALGGAASIRRQGSLVLSVRAEHVGRRLLGVWLAGGAAAPRFLGFAPPPRNARLAFSNPLPADATRYRVLLITRQGKPAQPTRHGAIVLSGTLRFP